MSRLGVHSEVGRLRQAIVHRPGLELSRLTPDNVGELLFDDILWSGRAREEHDGFTDALRQRGVTVHYFADLLAETLEVPDGRSYVLDRVCTDEMVGPGLARAVRDVADALDGPTLATYLVGGVVKADLRAALGRAVDPASLVRRARGAPRPVGSLTWDSLDDEDFVLPPLPNHLFQRDNSAWIYGGVSIHPMAMAARRRETIHSRAIYRYHPRFAGQGFPVWFGGDEEDHLPASLEGGDILVLGGGAVLIGMGERTSPPAVEMLARNLFAGGEVHQVIVTELPRSRAFMHLDTVMTMVDAETFVVYPHLEPHLRAWRLRPTDDGTAVEHLDDLWDALAGAMGIDKVRVLSSEDGRRAAAREQWDDGNNFLAVAPGVIVGYERNVATNAMLSRAGIDVVAVAGSELGRGRGGPRCMTCPVVRDPA